MQAAFEGDGTGCRTYSAPRFARHSSAHDLGHHTNVECAVGPRRHADRAGAGDRGRPRAGSDRRRWGIDRPHRSHRRRGRHALRHPQRRARLSAACGRTPRALPLAALPARGHGSAAGLGTRGDGVDGSRRQRQAPADGGSIPVCAGRCGLRPPRAGAAGAIALRVVPAAVWRPGPLAAQSCSTPRSVASARCRSWRMSTSRAS